MKIGYVRVWAGEENPVLQTIQTNALSAAGCEVIFTDQDVQPGDLHSKRHPGLNAALRRLSRGDTLVVWRLDRVAASVSKLIDLISQIGIEDIGFASIAEGIDINYPDGAPILHVMAALAFFDQTTVSERTRAGLAEARLQGKTLGRRRALTPDQRILAMQLLSSYKSTTEVAKEFNVHPRTLRRMLNEEKNRKGETSPDNQKRPKGTAH